MRSYLNPSLADDMYHTCHTPGLWRARGRKLGVVKIVCRFESHLSCSGGVLERVPRNISTCGAMDTRLDPAANERAASRAP